MMSCCGDFIKEAAQKAGQIVTGYGRWITDKSGLTSISPEILKKGEICNQCDKITWMSLKEFWDFLRKYGIDKKPNVALTAEKLIHLEKLPELPKQQRDEKRRYSFCGICKCSIPQAIRAIGKKCLHPQGDKWKIKEKNI